MPKVIRIKKGLSIQLKGEAERIMHEFVQPKLIALKPTDFLGLIPKLVVKEGDSVLAGDPLFVDKNKPEVQFTTPISGEVTAIVRGEKRQILEVVVAATETNNYKKFKTEGFSSFKREQLVSLILTSGIWPFIKQRPYNCIANPTDIPKSIFISTFDTSPLAPDYSFALAEYKKEFKIGVSVLQKLTTGKVHISILEEHRTLHPFDDCDGVENHYFAGVHPTGNVGIQIHHIAPINKGDIVWTINPQDVIILGRLFELGIFDAHKVIAVTGNVHLPMYSKTMLGATISSCIAQEQITENTRIISGNVLTGTKISYSGFIGFYDSQVTVIEEGNKPEFMGWISSGFDKFSLSRTFFSWLQKDKKYTLHTNMNGGERAFVFTGVYEKVLPMNIYPMHLLKAIIVNDIEKMEQLGIYEVVEEDFALCEFVCPSKIEIQSIIRQGLDVIKKEFS